MSLGSPVPADVVMGFVKYVYYKITGEIPVRSYSYMNGT